MTPPNESSDMAMKAKVLAESAHKRIDRHEDQCGKYYREMREEFHELSGKLSQQIGEIYAKIDLIQTRNADWWKAILVGIIGALVTALGYLLINGRPWI